VAVVVVVGIVSAGTLPVPVLGTDEVPVGTVVVTGLAVVCVAGPVVLVPVPPVGVVPAGVPLLVVLPCEPLGLFAVVVLGAALEPPPPQADRAKAVSKMPMSAQARPPRRAVGETGKKGSKNMF
jgi:hypothetical protein